MEFRVLGPLEILDDEGRRVSLRGARERVVLALLLLSPNRVVPSSRLATELWGDRLPQGAAHALHVHVARLRKAIRDAGGGEVLTTQPPGYLIQVNPEAIDAFRFESLVVQARELAARGDHDQAAVILREALGLWRGSALTDVVDAPLARTEATRLEEGRLAALEERVDADLACGRHGELVAELDALTRANPLRERLWGQRMLALYRAGRQAEALRAYQEVRLVLSELGLEPSAALTRLEASILRQEPQLDWPPEPRPPSVRPMPAFLTETGRIFVGRRRELEQLEELWKAAEAGDRRVVLLAGEPGVGKTRLAAELADRVQARNAMVLAGRCDEDLGVPYQPFVEALRHFVEHTPAPDLPRLLGRHVGELVRLHPDLMPRIPRLAPPLQADPETERYRLFDAVAAWLAAASAEQPLLLVLDDLQWAAKPTLLLLRHVARSADVKRIVVLGTYRDTELTHDHPLVDVVADLRRDDAVDRVSLSGLDDTAVTDLVEQVAGQPLDDDGLAVARAIHEETEGNPFFVREVLRHLAESGAIERHDERWRTRLPIHQLGIPEGIRDVVGRRLARLSPNTNQALRMAAVAGGEFEIDVLEAAGDFDQDALLAAMDEASGARLVTEVAAGRYRFSHALVRATLYESLTASRKVPLHRRLAEAIERVHREALHDDLPALAHHWAKASPALADPAKAVEYATRAGDRALIQLAHDEAATYYRQALEFLGSATDDPRRVDLLIALGEAQRRAGDPAHRDTLLEAGRLARRLGDAENCARAALANHSGLFSRYFDVDAERVAALEDALEAVGPSETPTRARLLAALAGELYFVHDDRRWALGGEALTVARRLGDAATLAEVLASVWYATWDPATRPERTALVAELADLARQLGDHLLGFQAGLALFLTAMQEGDVDRADSELEKCARLADELHQPVPRWRLLYSRANREMAAGRFEAAERLVEDARRLAEAIGHPDSAYCYDTGIASLRLLEDRPEEALAICERRRSVLPHLGALAWCYAAIGRAEDAAAIVRDLRPDHFRRVPRDHGWLVTLTFLARAGAGVGESESASELYELLLPCRHEVVAFHMGWAGPVAADLGLLAASLSRFEEAHAHFGAAAEILERMGSPVRLAQVRLAWARMLLTRRQSGDVERARELLRGALTVARELGLDAVKGRAEALMLR